MKMLQMLIIIMVYLNLVACIWIRLLVLPEDLVNEIQKYKLKPKDLYRLYIEILPKSKQWLRYTKGKKTMKYQKWLLEIVAKYYESSISEAHDYLEIYYSSEQGKADLKSILQKYGVEPKEIMKLNLP